MHDFRIIQAQIINEGKITKGDLLISKGRIQQIGSDLSGHPARHEINLNGAFLIPGIIDDQVHFREPGLTHKADIHSESAAAVAGGVTSYMEMPNTKPPCLTQELLAKKYTLGKKNSVANYSFFMGAGNENLEEVLKTKASDVCGVKVFMGSSTGNMLVDDAATLNGIFSKVALPIAVHCEDEATIRKNLKQYQEQYGDDIPVSLHPVIRSAEACYQSSSLAVALARKYGTSLHVLHISTARELGLFDSHLPLEQKKITAEACIHHLWFTNEDYERLGNRIKWNPAVKTRADREAIRKAVISGAIDIIATDHAPHTLSEKANPYTSAPSGGPLIQHGLQAMDAMCQQGVFSRELMVEKMCHNPAKRFQIKDRGFIREGYYADLAAYTINEQETVEDDALLYKCKWSPFSGYSFPNKILYTFVSGQLAFEQGTVHRHVKGMRLEFER